MESQDKKNIKWGDISSAKIKMQLMEYKNHHESIKNQVSILLDKLNEIEKKYEEGNKELIKRKNGII
jgi:hypothetical protein